MVCLHHFEKQMLKLCLPNEQLISAKTRVDYKLPEARRLVYIAFSQLFVAMLSLLNKQ